MTHFQSCADMHHELRGKWLANAAVITLWFKVSLPTDRVRRSPAGRQSLFRRGRPRTVPVLPLRSADRARQREVASVVFFMRVGSSRCVVRMRGKRVHSNAPALVRMSACDQVHRSKQRRHEFCRSFCHHTFSQRSWFRRDSLLPHFIGGPHTRARHSRESFSRLKVWL